MAFRIVKKEEQEQPSIGKKIFETAQRLPAQAGKGILSEIGGVFGNVAKTANDLIAAPLTELITGKEAIPYEQTPFGKVLPTTQQNIRSFEQQFPSLKPQNKFEEFSRDVAADTAGLFLPGKYFKMGKYALTGMKSLGIATAANVAGKGTELWTGDKSKGDMVKGGSMLALSLLNPTSAKNISTNLYRSAEALLPQNSSLNASRFMGKLDSIENSIVQGRPKGNLSPSEKFVVDEIDKFRKLDQSGRIDMHQLTAQKRSFNEDLKKHIFETPDKLARAGTKKQSLRVSGAVRDAMEEYGMHNPEWWKYQRSADMTHGAIEQSNYMSRVLEKYLKGKPETMAYVFGAALPGATAALSPLTGGGGLVAYQGAKFAHRIIKSPELRKHYAKVLGAAAADNPKLIQKELDEFEKEVEKETSGSKGKYKIVKK